ncbi:LCP family protein [Ornithinimicrobium sp. Y1847]|uniref:LCP family protein n=1 Tax=Ornithinimicrobium sp. Y1847 TaxID=3405419 RepID=UPI003B6829A2
MTDEHEGAGGAHATYRTRDEWLRAQSGSAGRTLPRAYGLTALSALLPGSGLLRTKAWKIGAVLVAIAVGTLLALGVYVARTGLTRSALLTASDEDRLRVILGVLVAGTIVWIGAIAFTALLARPRSMSLGQRTGLAAFTGLLCLAVSTPAALGLQYITPHIEAMDKVFNQPTKPGDPEPTSVLSEKPEDPWETLPRVNVLLLGSDAAEAREGTRTDTMMVASIDTHTGDTVLFSIPRNLERVPIPRSSPLHRAWPNGYDCGDACLMNGIWTEAEALADENPGWFTGDPTPGLTATRDVIGAVLGLKIHHSVVVNLQGFEDLIDAMGGVTITVPERIPINARTYTDWEGRLQMDPNSPQLEWIEEGVQHLNGNQALGYSRSRVTTDDFSRMRRQRCMVAAVIDQADPLRMLQRYPQIITAVGNNVVTDLPQDDLPTWAELVLQIQAGKIKSLPFTAQNTNVVNPDFASIRGQVWEAINPPPPVEPTQEPVETAPETTAPDDTEVTTAPGEDEETTQPPDELAEIGTVCD